MSRSNGFQLSGANLGVRFPDLAIRVARGLVDQSLRVIQDSLGAGLRVTELPGSRELLGEVPDE